MSRSFRYWARCILVLSLTCLITFNPAWAGRGLRGWLKKKQGCCTTNVCCQPAACCAPPVQACCPAIVDSCSVPVVPDCGCSAGATAITNQVIEEAGLAPSVLVPGIEIAPAPSLEPGSASSQPSVESYTPSESPEISPSDVGGLEPAQDTPAPESNESPSEIQPVTPDAEDTTEPAVPESETPIVEPTTEDNIPATDDVFGNEPTEQPNLQPPTDDELFGETSVAEPEPLVEPENAAPADPFDTPADPLPSEGESLDNLSPETFDATPVEPSNSTDELFGDPDSAAVVEPATAETADSQPAFDEPVADEPTVVEATSPNSTTALPLENGEEDLFGQNPVPATESPASVTENPVEDDLFGQSATPANEQSESDLFGQPDTSSEGQSQPALSPESTAPDANGADDSPQIPSVDSEDDLFGIPSDEGTKVESKDEDVDLFGLDFERTWRDNTGTFQVQATLAEIQTDHVRLLKSNGNYCNVPLRRLSTEDRALVELIVSTLPPGGKKFVSVTPAGK